MHENKYVSAPIIFIDEEKRKEWEEMEPSLKREVYSLLHSCADKMETKVMIEMLCNVIIDMDKRIQDLEKFEDRIENEKDNKNE